MFRGLTVWLIIMGLETLHGILREKHLVPVVGPVRATEIGWPIGLVIVLATTWALAKWAGLHDSSDLLKLGAIWAVLTFGFETGIGLFRGIPLNIMIGQLNPLSGSLLPLSLIVMLLAPLTMTRLRRV